VAGKPAVKMRLGRDVQLSRPVPLAGGGQHKLLFDAEGRFRSHGLSFRGKVILSGDVCRVLHDARLARARPSDRKSIAAWRHEQRDVVVALGSGQVQQREIAHWQRMSVSEARGLT
jgi:hypothetical protein